MLRDAIRAFHKVEFDYEARSTGRLSRQLVEPYGVLYGNRPYMIGRTDWSDEPRLWSLANMSKARVSDQTFVSNREFDLQEFAERSFGAFQEEPVDVVLRFDVQSATDARTYLFHPEPETYRQRRRDIGRYNSALAG